MATLRCNFSIFSWLFCYDLLRDRLLFSTMSLGEVVRQVSTASQRRFELGISRACCRNLFGPIDHEQLRAELEHELKRIADEKKRKWNFDFMKLEPLDGDFLWQRIDENRTVGFATSEPDTRVSDRHSDGAAHSILPTPEAHAEETSNSRIGASNTRSSCFKTPERASTKRLRKSPRITDYLRSKKKHSTSRRIKFTEQAGDQKLCKRVQTRKVNASRRQPSKQSAIELYMPKLRPRHANGKVQVST